MGQLVTDKDINNLQLSTYSTVVYVPATSVEVSPATELVGVEPTPAAVWDKNKTCITM